MPPEPPHIASLPKTPASWRQAVVAIGNFDGVHAGHQSVLSAAKAEAEHLSAPCIVLTFEPHPRTFFAPERPIFRLTPAALKAALVAACGLDGTLVMDFDAEVAAMPAEAFIENVLIDRLAVRHVVTGYDFHFGHKRGGTPKFLQESGLLHGFGVSVVSEHGDEAGAVSSSRIRQALSEGDIFAANALLRWSWAVAGEVVHGDRRGRQLGYPTANIATAPDAGLRHGIYAVRLLRADGSLHDGVASFGRRPTFDDGEPVLETFAFDFDANLYGETVLVSLVAWLRAEQAFASADELVAEMHRDAEVARHRLRDTPPLALDAAFAAIWPAVLADSRALGL